MEQAALKSSVRKEMALKAAPPVYEEFISITTAQNGCPADDFSVDDLLDFSNNDVFADEEADPKAQQDTAEQDMVRVSSEDEGDALLRSNDFSGGAEFGSLPSEVSLPAEDLANLEWLSHFVDDSFTEHAGMNLTGTSTEKPAWLTRDRKHPVTPATEESYFESPVPAKTRTKRFRSAIKVWSHGSSSSSGPSSSGSNSSSSSSGPSSPLFSVSDVVKPLVTSDKPPVPKKHKKRSAESVFRGQLQQLQQPPRRCSHCGVQKTPQWRAGPMGAKTLCNACGVRFKSGRLLPEYRPACSPTFSSELHSNHHRKVMEMRQKKEPNSDNDEASLNQLVQSPQAVSSF